MAKIEKNSRIAQAAARGLNNRVAPLTALHNLVAEMAAAVTAENSAARDQGQGDLHPKGVASLLYQAAQLIEQAIEIDQHGAPPEPEQLVVTYEVGSYNTSRYGRPWIALVTAWPIGGHPTLEFGGSMTRQAEIAAPAGALVKFGQKDGRGNKSLNSFAVVGADGTLQPLDEVDARSYWLNQHMGGDR